MIPMLTISLLLTAAAPAAPANASPTAISDSFRSLVLDSRTAMQDGRYQDAIDAIDAAQQRLEVPSAKLAYNRAVANYRLGNWTEAADGFTDAIARSDDPTLLNDSIYNLGNVTHQQVVDALQSGDQSSAQQAIQQLDAAREQLDSALGHYRTAIRSNPRNEDARANAEMTWDLMKQLQQMKEQLEQQQQQDQQQQQQDQQQQQQDQQQQQQQQDQQQQQQDQQQQEQDQQQQERQELEDALEQLEDTMQQLEEAIENQQDRLDQNPLDQQAQQQLRELEQLQDQLEDMQGELQERLDQQSDSPPKEQTEQEPSSEEPRPADESTGAGSGAEREDGMNQDEAQRLLQAVRDKERLRRLERIERERSGTPVTGKDW